MKPNKYIESRIHSKSVISTLIQSFYYLFDLIITDLVARTGSQCTPLGRCRWPPETHRAYCSCPLGSGCTRPGVSRRHPYQRHHLP